MKALIFFPLLLLNFNLLAEPSRKPAIIEDECDLNVETFKKSSASEKTFSSEIIQNIVIPSDKGIKCSKSNIKFNDLLYEEYARSEMQVSMDKYPQRYIQSCLSYFDAKKLKKSEYECLAPKNISMSLKDFRCENQVAKATALIMYDHSGYILEEKPLKVVQEEQCAKVNECLKFASKSELSELLKLSSVACKNNLVLPDSGKAPTLPSNNPYSLDSNRSQDVKLENSPEEDKNKLKNMGK
jgi:hypothetical protein